MTRPAPVALSPPAHVLLAIVDETEKTARIGRGHAVLRTDDVVIVCALAREAVVARMRAAMNGGNFSD